MAMVREIPTSIDADTYCAKALPGDVGIANRNLRQDEIFIDLGMQEIDGNFVFRDMLHPRLSIHLGHGLGIDLAFEQVEGGHDIGMPLFQFRAVNDNGLIQRKVLQVISSTCKL